MSRIKGGCLCGTVRYECNAEPLMTAVCHCTHCQKTSGSAFSINIGVPADSVAISGGSLARFKDVGTSGKPAWRSFCQTCGSSLATEAEAFPGVVFLKAGTLDDPSWLDPKLHIWTQSKQPWVTIGPDATQVEQNPG
ncbi:MAG: GFA family protein [Rhodoplanes sp.]